MQVKKSFEKQLSGTLYVVPTPIGNLEDITYRAIKTLKAVKIIAAEDTRNTKNLLRHFDIETALISYHEHNKYAREQMLLEHLERGESVALVSDAGMPGISDPGMEIIQACIKAEQAVVVLPGANAGLCALVGSGLSTKSFLFYGFLPRKKKEKEAVLGDLKQEQATLLYYESPYRLKETVTAMEKVLGDRNVVIARELTKRFETYIRGTLREVLTWLNEEEVKGECCIVVEGSLHKDDDAGTLWWSYLSVVEHVDEYRKREEISSKEAIKKVAKDRKMGKREVYQMYHVK